jgi:hypothetical protein
LAGVVGLPLVNLLLAQVAEDDGADAEEDARSEAAAQRDRNDANDHRDEAEGVVRLPAGCLGRRLVRCGQLASSPIGTRQGECPAA